MCGVPKFRFVVKLNENRVRGGIGTENRLTGKFLIECPQELVHVHVGIGGGRVECEGSSGLRALFEDHLMEASQIWRIGDAYRPVLVGRNESLHLKSD